MNGTGEARQSKIQVEPPVSRITIDQFNDLLRHEIPWADGMMWADAVGAGAASMRLAYKPNMLRPGGTIAGPFMMALADACMYAVVLSAIGIVKMAVTTSFNVNFLHRPQPGDMIADGRLMKLGKRLAVVEVTIHSDGFDDAVAHATGTYSLPPDWQVTPGEVL